MAPAEEPALIGYSLSFCVADILRGTVNESDVTRIVAGILAPTRDDFEQVLEGYAPCYWRKNPDEGKAIARRLYDAGKIDQPRLRGEEAMHIGNGHWKTIEPGTQPAVPQKDDEHVGLYDPEAMRPETRIAATVTSLTQGTRAPVMVRKLRFKAPGGQ